MKKILAIDTVTSACSVALHKNGINYTRFEKCNKNHNQLILPQINSVLNQSQTYLNELDAIAFNRGPGSFTGIRISLGITQGLALGAKLPVIGISTFSSIAQAVWFKTGITKILIAIDACMNEVYWAEYTRDSNGIWHGKKTENLIKSNTVTKKLKQLSGTWAIAGTGWKSIPKITNNTLILIDSGILISEAVNMLTIAYNLLINGHAVNIDYAKPTYLRNKVINN